MQQQPKRSQQAALASGSQPLKKIQPLVQEYSHIEVVKNLPSSFECPLDNKHCFSACVQFGSQQPLIIHKGTKLLRRTIVKGGQTIRTTEGLDEAIVNPNLGPSAAPDKLQDAHEFCEDCKGRVVVELCRDQQDTVEIACGVFRSPEEFVKACCSVPHPKDIFTGVSDEVCHAIRTCSSKPSHEIVVHRMQWLGKYIQPARDLADEEKLLMESVCKRIRLLEKMIEDEGYPDKPDKSLPQDIASGFSLVGHAPSSSGILPSKIEPATLAVSELEEHAAMGGSAVRYSTVSSGDEALDEELLDEDQCRGRERLVGWVLKLG